MWTAGEWWFNHGILSNNWLFNDLVLTQPWKHCIEYSLINVWPWKKAGAPDSKGVGLLHNIGSLADTLKMTVLRQRFAEPTGYPLVNAYITMENHHAVQGWIHSKPAFSIAMWAITRGELWAKDGKSPCFTMVFLWFSCFSYDHLTHRILAQAAAAALSCFEGRPTEHPHPWDGEVPRYLGGHDLWRNPIDPYSRYYMNHSLIRYY